MSTWCGSILHKGARRPCVVISPDERGTVIVAPLTTKGRPYPTRIPLRFQRKSGQIVLDQVRTVDKSRLVRRLGKISDRAAVEVLVVPRSRDRFCAFEDLNQHICDAARHGYPQGVPGTFFVNSHSRKILTGLGLVRVVAGLDGLNPLTLGALILIKLG